MIQKKRRFAALAALLIALTGFAGVSRACLRELLDARAIQWSTSIVQAKLISIGTAQALDGPTTRPDAWTYLTYTFQISDVFDGPDLTAPIQVIRFQGPQETRSNPCGQTFDQQSLGKAYVLMLRSESDVPWSDQPTDVDPRTPALHALGAYVLVHIESSADLGKDGLADLRQQIADTRAAEVQFSADQARTQATTLATAADDTEADQAEQALLAMGIKAIPIIQEVQKGATDLGKTQLQRVIDTLAVPAIVRAK
ncbi:MAG: hypothetical protein ABSF29_05035 [Tepidisphaeraceae bacterium]|jgi:hypothetical protein